MHRKEITRGASLRYLMVRAGKCAPRRFWWRPREPFLVVLDFEWGQRVRSGFCILDVAGWSFRRSSSCSLICMVKTFRSGEVRRTLPYCNLAVMGEAIITFSQEPNAFWRLASAKVADLLMENLCWSFLLWLGWSIWRLFGPLPVVTGRLKIPGLVL